ncbi:MAG: nucleotidyltransferase domain-containing protein [Promethearchaeia archaeon]
MNLSENDNEELQKIISKLQQDEDVLAAIFYGSALKTTNYHDIDLAIVTRIDSSPKSLKYLLQFPEKFDVHFLSEMPVIIAKEAIKGKILFNKDYSQLFDVFIKIIKEWVSFRPYYKLYLESVKDGL